MASTSANIFTDEVAQTKLLSALILFFMTLICGYVPVRTIVNQNLIQYAMYGGGGVLMATAFCHLIPETHDNYKLLSAEVSGATSKLAGNASQPSPFASLPAPISAAPTATPSALSTQTSLTAPTNSSSTTTRATTYLPSGNSSSGHSDSNHNEHNQLAHEALHLISSLNLPYVEVTLCCGFFFMYIVELLMIRFVNTHTHQHPCDTSLVQLCVDTNPAGAGSGSNHNHNNNSNSNNGASSSVLPANSQRHQVNLFDSPIIVAAGGRASSSTSSSSTTKGTGFYKFIRGLLIVSAFGAHSLFDGVAIGSQESVEKVWTVFAAISCHKLIIAAVVGLELYAATLESHLWTVVHLSLFSIMSPIGIVLVVVAQNSLHLDSNHPAMILLQSFATGTLLYIIFVEILQPKGDHSLERNRLGKSISLVAGFALMLLVLTLMDDQD